MAKEMGYKKIITYILESEPGVTMRASGWVKEAENVGGGKNGWNVPSRPREVVSTNLFGETTIHYPLEKKSKICKKPINIMICAKDIQIGDWVLFATRPTKINGIAEGGFSVNLEHEGWRSTSAIAPIPLTAEILEKNGIKLEEVGDNGISTPPKWRNRFEKWVLRTQWKDTFIWYDRTAKYWHLHDMGAAKLHYVHELQNALRLCRIEKEIEL